MAAPMPLEAPAINARLPVLAPVCVVMSFSLYRESSFPKARRAS
jgi:hypothetical protein